jgi:hypothetical protein
MIAKFSPELSKIHLMPRLKTVKMKSVEEIQSRIDALEALCKLADNEDLVVWQGKLETLRWTISD